MPVAEMVNYSRHIVARYYGKRLPFLCTGELIYGFFRYYAAEFDEGNHVCQVVSSLDVEKKKKLKKPFVVVEGNVGGGKMSPFSCLLSILMRFFE